MPYFLFGGGMHVLTTTTLTMIVSLGTFIAMHSRSEEVAAAAVMQDGNGKLLCSVRPVQEQDDVRVVARLIKQPPRPHVPRSLRPGPSHGPLFNTPVTHLHPSHRDDV